LNIVDSSAWLEVLVAGPNAQTFLQVIEEGELVVPAITIFEVCKRIRLTQSVAEADRIESHMRRFTVIDLTADRASAAAALSLKHKLPMADGIIYAAALELGATVWTQDADFKGLAQVKFFKKTPV
jgi:toxin FitB